jgi:hypothetical protein
VKFTKVQEIFAGDNGEYVGFLRIIKDDVAEARQILKACSGLAAEKAFLDLKHNMISTMRVFSLEELSALFEQGKVTLIKADSAGFTAAVEQLIVGFDAFDVALDEELVPSS